MGVKFLVPEFQPASPNHKLITRRPCLRCGWDMTVASMIRDDPTCQRAYECSTCEHFEATSGRIS
jgi:hypothetical protein